MFHQQRFQQAVILGGIVLCSISDGYIFGQMSGMVASLRSKDSEIPVTDDEISWIISTINAACVCGLGLVSLISERFGRKFAITALTSPIIAVWIMLYFAKHVSTLIISRFIVGICFGGVIQMCMVASCEYMSPKIRPLCLNLVISAAPFIGITLGHVLGIFFHWRTVALIGLIPTGLSALLPCFWIESPSWLAYKGRFEECEKNFKILHGNQNKQELQLLMQLQKKTIIKFKNKDFDFTCKKIRSAMTKRYFFEIGVLCTFVSLYRATAGKVLFSTIAITMLQEITGKTDVLLFTLLIDGFSIFGAFAGCFLLQKMKMRSLLFYSGVVANLFLGLLIAGLYFKPEGNIYSSWANCTFLALYFVIVNAGPYPVLETLLGEMFPLDIKGGCVFIFGTIGGALHFFIIKYSSNMFSVVGYHGVFLFNLGCMTWCLIYFWFKMPETKGRTLQEIELYFKNNTFDKADIVLLGDEQVKVLI